jgi:MYXO-CTERM domain-containing protein
MRRWWPGSWRRYALQVGVLVGSAAAVGTGTPVTAAPMCPSEATCGLLKPLVLFVLDSSTSMNEPFDLYKTRWVAARSAIELAIDGDNGWLASHFMLGLIRFGHDPDPAVPGTPIPDDTTGLVDGSSLDVLPYDADDPNHPYFDCTSGQTIVDFLSGLPPPLNGKHEGIAAWTRGGLERARATVEKAAADHPAELGKRPAALILVTDGPWTDAAGIQSLAPPGEDPAQTAFDLWTELGVPTYVVTLGEAVDAAFADSLALAGGTGAPSPMLCGEDPHAAFGPILTALDEQVTVGPCAVDIPRVMFVLDASSSMLNVGGGTQAGSMGQTGWDQVRAELAGSNSIFDHPVGVQAQPLEDYFLAGLTVFGHNNPAPGEQKVVVDYGPCHKDNIDWALNPLTSCGVGCTDPWGGPPITWTFKDGSKELPFFEEPTVSHMPRCDASIPYPQACVGSGTYTHLGLQLVQANMAAYKTACQQEDALYPCSGATRFINVLITDGAYNSTNAQVQAALEQMYADGVTTYVLGFGDYVNSVEAITKLQNMADWGSGGALDYYKVHNQLQLQAGLQEIFTAEFAAVTIDPCCGGFACDYAPEPGLEPDPPPDTEGPPPLCGPWDESSTGTDSTGAGSTSTGSTGDDSTGAGSTGDASTGTGSTGGGGETTTTTTVGGSTTTGEPQPTTGADSFTSSGDEDSDTSDGATTGAAGTPSDGCGCSTDGTRGTGLALGTAAFLLMSRRRRRAVLRLPCFALAFALTACGVGSDPLTTSAGSLASTSADATTGTTQSMTTTSSADSSTTGGGASPTEATGTSDATTLASTSTGEPSCSGGSNDTWLSCNDKPCQPDDSPCSDPSGCGCASGRCFVVPALGGWCGECMTDDDCRDGGCTLPDPIQGLGAVCNAGGPGDGCMSDAVCNDAAAPHCGTVLHVPQIVTVSTCGECKTNADCTDPEAPNCSPEYELEHFTGKFVCLPDGSVPLHGGCSPVLDEMGVPVGDWACASGSCGVIKHMALLELGVCGECSVDGDCGPGEQCAAAQVDLEAGVLLGATCQ